MAPEIEKRIYFGSAVKALGNGRIEGMLIAFTDDTTKDLHDEYFSTSTDLHLNDYPITESLGVLYQHGLDDTIGIKKIGKVLNARVDNAGVWLEAQLDLADEYQQMIHQMAKDGKLGWSSGALPQSVKVADDGLITSWAVIEASVTPTPAMPYATRIQSAKNLRVPTATATKETSESKESNADNATPINKQEPEKDEHNMDESMIRQIIRMVWEEFKTMSDGEAVVEEDDLVEAVAMDIPEDEKMDEEELAKFVAEKTWAVIDAKLAKRQKALDAVNIINKQKAANAPVADDAHLPATRKSGGQGAQPVSIRVTDKYPNWNSEDYLFAALLDRQIQAKGKPGILGNPDDAQKFYREFASKAEKEQFQLPPSGQRAVKSIKADELNHSTQVAYGDEWVPDSWDNNLWRKARIETVVLPQFRNIEMPSNPFELPIEGADSTMYFVPETTNESQLTLSGAGSPIPDSKIGSGKVQLSAKKFGMRVGFSAELEEDSIIPVLNIYRQQAETAFNEGVDDVLVNGDTEAGTTNINNDGAALAGTSRYLAFNGLRKDTFTNATNQINGLGSAPTLSNIRKLRFLLSRRVSTKIPGLCIFVNPEAYGKLLNMDEFLTMDKAGSLATAQTGQIGFIDNIPVFATDQMPLADTDGKVTNGANGTDTGSLLIVYKPHWYVGYRRRLASSLDYIPYYDSYQLTMTARMDFVTRDADSAALLYNIGI